LVKSYTSSSTIM